MTITLAYVLFLNFSNVQENYFDCLTNVARCCDPLLQEIDLQHEHFMQNGGQACPDVHLNKMTNCIELRTFCLFLFSTAVGYTIVLFQLKWDSLRFGKV